MGRLKIAPWAIILLFAFLLTGCSQSPEEKIYKTLEKTAELETGFKEQQNPLIRLEEQENKLYEEIVSLGLKESGEVKKISEEALEVLNQQRELIDTEKESIEASKEEFLKTEEFIEKIKKEDLKQDAESLFATMNERYDTYSQLHEKYIERIENNKKLYDAFLQKQNLSVTELESQINKINETSEQLYELNDRFNELTRKYNDEKINFYTKAGLKIETAENG